jgi:predicted transcriptional regulator
MSEPNWKLSVTGQIVSAYLSNNQLQATLLPDLIGAVYKAVPDANSGASTPPKVPVNTIPAVPVKKSVADAYIVCLEDGKRLKMLKRYLRTHYDLSPEDYRRKWGLPSDYPMIAPAYARQRSDFAKSIGLGKSTEPARKKERQK